MLIDFDNIPLPVCDGVTVKLTGTDGNAFSVLGKTIKAMERSGVPGEIVDEYKALAMAGDYDNLLRVTMQFVNVD